MLRGSKILAAVLMLMIMLPAAFAEDDIDPNADLYVLNFGGIEFEGYPHSQKCIYPSPHYNYLIVTMPNGDVEYWNYTGHQVLNMIDPRRIPKGGEGLYASIPVYCLDAITNAVPGHAYRCMNLEESGHFDKETAGRIRAVMEHCFPFVRDLDAITDSVNTWLATVDGENYVPVEGLTETECITAAQTTLWSLTNDLTVYSAYRGTDDERFDADRCVFPDWLNQPKTSHTAGNCDSLVRYLTALPATQASDPVMTDASIVDAETVYTPRGNAYDAAVNVSLNVKCGSDDTLTIYATCGSVTSRKIALTAGKTDYTLNLTGLPDATTPATVHVEGEQTVKEALLFQPLGGRDASQTMGGLTEITTRVRATAVVSRSSIADPETPATGDAAPLGLLMLLMAFSCAGAWMLLRRAHR